MEGQAIKVLTQQQQDAGLQTILVVKPSPSCCGAHRMLPWQHDAKGSLRSSVQVATGGI